jgi:toxin HigB-1
MIKSFNSKNTESLFSRKRVRQYQAFEDDAREKLLLLDASIDLNDLRVPPGNRLEKLKGDRKGQYSIRINRRWRVCFSWKKEHAYDVEIVDYH